MTVLFITGELTGSATGYCAKTVAVELARRGHTVHVVSANRVYNETVECDGRLLIHEIPGNSLRRFINDSQDKKGLIQRIFGKVLLILQNLLIQIKGLFTIIPLFDDVDALFKRSSLVIKDGEVNVIIPVVNPRESVKVACLLYREYGIPYIPYYLDSIYGNIGLRILPVKIYRIKALHYEKRWLSDAISIIMMKSVKSLYDDLDSAKHKYVSKIVYMDLPMLSKHEKDCRGKQTDIFKEEFVVLFVGTMPNRVRDPRYVFKLIEQVASDDIHFYFAGRTDYESELANLIRTNSNVYFIGPVEHDLIGQYYSNADILLNVGNTTPGMLPSKVFEYMSYNKPIISTVKNQSDRSIPYLDLYGAAAIIDETKPFVTNEIEVRDFIRKVRSNELKIDISSLIDVTGPLYTNTPTCFCEGVESIMFNRL